MAMLPFALLAAALLVFLISTRQFPLVVRTPIWLAGLALLVASAWLVLSDHAHVGLFALIGDFFSHISEPGSSLLARALSGNWATVGAAIAPMFDIFLVIAAIIALVALLAFTPGEGIERAERPVNIALIGAIGGALFALVVAGVGFGGAAKRKIYMNVVSAADVIDGDTLRMGDVALRLWGVDAPESDQLCINGDNTAYRCGDMARTHLVELTAGKLVACGPPMPRRGGAPDQLPKLAETFGRPIVVCNIRSGDSDMDIARKMAKDGFVHVYQDSGGIKSDYTEEVGEAIRARRALHNREMLSPFSWRNDPAEKCSFLARVESGTVPPELRAEAARLHEGCKGFEAASNTPLALPAPTAAQAPP